MRLLVGGVSGARLLAAVRVAGMLLVAGSVAGCDIQYEAPVFDYHVWNYSAVSYVVFVQDPTGFGDFVAVPPDEIAASSTGGTIVTGIVYDATCSVLVARITFPQAVRDIVIAANGAISVPASPLGPRTSADPSSGRAGVVPDSCRSTSRPT